MSEVLILRFSLVKCIYESSWEKQNLIHYSDKCHSDDSTGNTFVLCISDVQIECRCFASGYFQQCHSTLELT